MIINRFFLLVAISIVTSKAFPLQIDAEKFDGIYNGLNKFAVQLHKTIATNLTNNFVCSPLSVSMMLGMTMYGAVGHTRERLQSALYLSLNDNQTEIRRGFQALVSRKKNMTRDGLWFVNKMFIESGIHMKKDFNDDIRDIFRSQIKSLDFSKLIGSAKSINDWCSDKTNGGVRDVIEPDDLKGASLVLIGAVYFKKRWETKFKTNRTNDINFYVNHDIPKRVSMMFKTEKLYHGNIAEYDTQFVEIPYESQGSKIELSMFVFMPRNKKGMTEFENMIHRQLPNALSFEGKASYITLTIPMFKIRSELKLNGILKKMGMDHLFSYSADFSRISENSLPKLSQVIQQVFIDVNEEGGEPVEVTGRNFDKITSYRIVSEHLEIDKPFLVAIVEKYTGVIVLTARVNDPTIGAESRRKKN